MNNNKHDSTNSIYSENSDPDHTYMSLSNDWNKERLETLKKLLPDLFTNEGKLNIAELKKAIDPGSISETERYEFKWFGKSAAKRQAFSPSNATLIFDEKRSINPSKSENLIIEGENLEVLKLLSISYREKIKCIYIDPPYNTGKDFVYSDHYAQGKKAYWEETGVTEEGLKIDTNSEADGRYHSNWLNMMYSRLLIARQLLREDGVIFISIDDNEVHHLRKLCDEVFGEDNFVSNIIWEKKFAPSNDAKWFSANHDHILCFAKNKEEYRPILLNRSEDALARYKNPDNDHRGVWVSGDMTVKTYNAQYDYQIKTPSGRIVSPPKGVCWRFSKEKFQSLIEENRVWFGENGDNVPRIKRFLADVKEGITPLTIWYHKDVGHNQEAAQECRRLFNSEQYFDTPKPTRLLKRIAELSLNRSDIMLDFFGGSGTTGQAVMELNQQDRGSRKFILVQIPEATNQTSEAYKAGYKKISDITIERNVRVVKKIKSELEAKAIKEKQVNPLFTNGDSDNFQHSGSNGLGFKVFKLVKSNFPRVEFAPDPEKTTEQNIALLKKYIAEKEAQLITPFNRNGLITEILLKNGFMLNTQKSIFAEFSGKREGLAGSYSQTIELVTDGEKESLLCLDEFILNETIEYFKKHNTKKFICLERALDSTKKWNLKHYLGDKFNAF